MCRIVCSKPLPEEGSSVTSLVRPAVKATSEGRTSDDGGWPWICAISVANRLKIWGSVSSMVPNSAVFCEGQNRGEIEDGRLGQDLLTADTELEKR